MIYARFTFHFINCRFPITEVIRDFIIYCISVAVLVFCLRWLSSFYGFIINVSVTESKEQPNNMRVAERNNRRHDMCRTKTFNDVRSNNSTRSLDNSLVVSDIVADVIALIHVGRL